MSAPRDRVSDLARRNRVVLAERLAWPPGTVEACERLERERPGWSVWWLPANEIKGWERPSGYLASRDDVLLRDADVLRRLPGDGVRRAPRVFASGANGLVRRIDAMQERIDAVAEEDERLWRAMKQFRLDGG